MAAVDPATLRAIAADDNAGCEWCDWRGLVEQLCRHVDVQLCPECDSKWRKIFKQCVHDWSPDPAYDDYGDQGRYCTRCAAFVEDESAMILFPLICDGWLPEAIL
jgi:hypothetical protein